MGCAAGRFGRLRAHVADELDRPATRATRRTLGLAMTARDAAVRLWATESPTRQCGGELKDTCCREDGTAWTANVSATDGSDREPSATRPPFSWCQKTGGLRFKTREVHASVTAVQAVR